MKKYNNYYKNRGIKIQKEIRGEISANFTIFRKFEEILPKLRKNMKQFRRNSKEIFLTYSFGKFLKKFHRYSSETGNFGTISKKM